MLITTSSLTTSPDAERSFSKYNQLLTPLRTYLTPETLHMVVFVLEFKCLETLELQCSSLDCLEFWTVILEC